MGPDGAQTIDIIFRYLDLNGGGDVSCIEWQVLDQLWQELTLCLEEFVNHLKRKFNYSRDFLADAWDALDDDDVGCIAKEDWDGSLKRTLKYCGPSATLFHFLDKDKEGTVSLDEFRALELFNKPSYSPK